MQGKYSPTVTRAYYKDQNWHRKFMSLGCYIYDLEGYDSYGYNKEGKDRAGNEESEYYSNDALYDDTSDDWGFDSTKPVNTN